MRDYINNFYKNKILKAIIKRYFIIQIDIPPRPDLLKVKIDIKREGQHRE